MMDCCTTDIEKGKRKGVTQSPIVHMARKSLFVYLVVEMGFVSIRELNSLARIVMVDSCAKPHTVLPEKIRNMMDTVGIALPICFRIRLLHGIV